MEYRWRTVLSSGPRDAIEFSPFTDTLGHYCPAHYCHYSQLFVLGFFRLFPLVLSRSYQNTKIPIFFSEKNGKIIIIILFLFFSFLIITVPLSFHLHSTEVPPPSFLLSFRLPFPFSFSRFFPTLTTSYTLIRNIDRKLASIHSLQLLVDSPHH